MSRATAIPGPHINGMDFLSTQAYQRYPPTSPRPRSPEPQPFVVHHQKAPEFSDSDGERVTPDEVLTLGVLALAGLWSGTWAGIAAIIVKQVDRLAQRGAADLPFRRCAMSLVDMLLKTPGDPTVAVETWRHLAAAQARLPDDLSQVLGLACSLLQSRTMEAADIRLRKKRRRAGSTDTVAVMSAPPPRFTPPCATALVELVIDMDLEEENKRKEKDKQVEQDARRRWRNSPANEAALTSSSSAAWQQFTSPLHLPSPPEPADVHPHQHRQHLEPLPHPNNFVPALSLQLPVMPSDNLQNGAAGWGVAASRASGSGNVAASSVGSSNAFPASAQLSHPQRQYEWGLGGGSQIGYYPPQPRAAGYSSGGYFGPQR